jgi:hypothetical protein
MEQISNLTAKESIENIKTHKGSTTHCCTITGTLNN